MEKSEDPIITLLQDYSELNSTHVDILSELPSPLEFMRYVSLNRPFVIRSGASKWEATQCWNVAKLKQILKGQLINVAVTPYGNADSPLRNEEDGELLFLKPWEEKQNFDEFIDFIVEQEKRKKNEDGTFHEEKEVRYAQSQNDNLHHEYLSLFPYVENDIPWARIALQKSPDAINIWLGNSRSVTALHKDNYENIYVQVLGQKHFVLIPPIAYPGVCEKFLTPASYVKNPDGEWDVRREGGPKIPFPTWDIDTHSNVRWQQNKYSELISPIRVTLREGDMLYLPTLWYHKVSQSCSEQGICCAINYWYSLPV
ncbi:JmjC domain-containing protein 7 [Golovinomyces cichoracearum]|uniref:JmjC domain-containing protein 7 n=1 Tax=Golovinomyces cichoracearum TaxID=62708 RepID=A0A420HCT7_9PEZI|nr:JmjC domain-containing protein 7 [Golovinomyces cichoracearum]